MADEKVRFETSNRQTAVRVSVGDGKSILVDEDGYETKDQSIIGELDAQKHALKRVSSDDTKASTGAKADAKENK